MFKNRFLAMTLLLIFFFNLAAPAILFAKEQERWDEKMLLSLAEKVENLLTRVCTQLSEEEGNDVKLKTFFVDESERIFAQIDGSITLSFPVQNEKWQKKLKEATGSWLSTNGPVATDISIKKTTRKKDSSVLLHFSADVVIQSKLVVRKLIGSCTSILGSVSLGVVLSKLVAYLGSIDASLLGKAISTGFKKLWALGSGKTAAKVYQNIDESGHRGLRALLFKEISLKSIVYHFGVFILKAFTKVGATITKASFGTAIATALGSQFAVVVGSALAMAATILIGKVIVKKLTKNLPLWWRVRRLENLHVKALSGDEATREKIAKTEEAILSVIDDELQAGSFKVLDMLTEKLAEAYERSALGPYEELIKKVKQKLQFETVQNEDWVVARKYYQLLHAIARTPDEAD